MIWVYRYYVLICKKLRTNVYTKKLLNFTEKVFNIDFQCKLIAAAETFSTNLF